MRRFRLLLFPLLLAAVVAVPTSAGEKKKDDFLIPEVKLGPEHTFLASLAGTYDANVKFFMDPAKAPTESAGVMTRKMILDGHFLQESFKGTFFGKPFSGLGTIGYDQTRKKYVSAWCDSMSTTISVTHGTHDAANKTFTSVGEEIDRTGKKLKSRDVLKIVSDEEQLFEMYRQPEGAPSEFKVMEITYKRKKAK
jgi:hypothetical protein